MQIGALTGYIDVAQVVLYAFWVFFAGLVFYLRREDKREGYPLDSDRTERSGGRVEVVGFPAMPEPKTFLLRDGSTRSVPRPEPPSRPAGAQPVMPWPGSPLQPTGDPMADGLGPAAYAERADEPDLTLEGQPKIVPMRVDPDYWIAERDPDPRGMPVVALDGREAGVVRDIWVDRTEMRVLFLEMALPPAAAADDGGADATTAAADAEGGAEAGADAEGGAGTKGAARAKRRPRAKKGTGGEERVLLPINFARVDAARSVVRVVAIQAAQFAGVPRLRHPDRVTLLEEDRITAYFGGGHLYAHPARQEPLL